MNSNLNKNINVLTHLAVSSSKTNSTIAGVVQAAVAVVGSSVIRFAGATVTAWTLLTRVDWGLRPTGGQGNPSLTV